MTLDPPPTREARVSAYDMPHRLDAGRQAFGGAFARNNWTLAMKESVGICAGTANRGEHPIGAVLAQGFASAAIF